MSDLPLRTELKIRPHRGERGICFAVMHLCADMQRYMTREYSWPAHHHLQIWADLIKGMHHYGEPGGPHENKTLREWEYVCERWADGFPPTEMAENVVFQSVREMLAAIFTLGTFGLLDEEDVCAGDVISQYNYCLRVMRGDGYSTNMPTSLPHTHWYLGRVR